MAKIHGPKFQDPLPGGTMETCESCGATRVLYHGVDTGVSWSPWGFGFFQDPADWKKTITQDTTPWCSNKYNKEEVKDA